MIWHDMSKEQPSEMGLYLVWLGYYDKTARGPIDLAFWFDGYFARRTGEKYKNQPVKWTEITPPDNKWLTIQLNQSVSG